MPRPRPIPYCSFCGRPILDEEWHSQCGARLRRARERAWDGCLFVAALVGYATVLAYFAIALVAVLK